MNTVEACNLLGIKPEEFSSVDVVKRAFKKMAAEYHPDRNKSPDAEEKFKKINEAYQFLTNSTSKNTYHNESSVYYREDDYLVAELRRQMNNMFGINFGGVKFSSQPIIINIDIAFEISVLGGSKEVSYEHSVKCDKCNSGKVSVNKILCQKCGGNGWRKYANDDKELPCNSCKSTGYISSDTKCSVCKGTGIQNKVSTINVTIPSGAGRGMRLVLRGKGNYRPDVMSYDNVVVVLNVLPDHEMQLSGNDVIGVVELTLLEALKGTKKRLRTVKGEKTLTFKPKTRHRDTVRVSGFGVPPHGAHVFVVNVNYPDDVSKLIEVLENTDIPDPEEISGVQS